MANRKPDKGSFTPRNPEKYRGDPTKITYRSSWELTCMLFFDKNPSVVSWASETRKIPYLNPLLRDPKNPNGRWSVYIPDFIITIADASGIQRVEMIEIKPLSQTPGYVKISKKTGKPQKVSKRDQLEQIKNEAKWRAAMEFCNKAGWKFHVMTEETLFGSKRKK